jgi:hypothetical protein
MLINLRHKVIPAPSINKPINNNKVKVVVLPPENLTSFKTWLHVKISPFIESMTTPDPQLCPTLTHLTFCSNPGINPESESEVII